MLGDWGMTCWSNVCAFLFVVLVLLAWVDTLYIPVLGGFRTELSNISHLVCPTITWYSDQMK
jgi:hypothetical protein